MLQSRCISGCKSDSEFPRELHETLFLKKGFNSFWLEDSLLKWTWYLSNGMCMLVCLPVSRKKSRELVSSSEMKVGLT